MLPGFRSRHGIAALATFAARARDRRVLRAGELHSHERFGPDTVNRGAVLWECEWDGGVFESGVLLGGIFRAGVFRGGVVWAAYWKGGTWEGGLWHHGFGPDGAYRPRGAFPGNDVPALETEEARIDERGPRATVFAASVFGDLPRLWLSCLRRALPADEVRFELFDDSVDGSLDGRLLPGVAVLPRSPARPRLPGRVWRRPEARDDASPRLRRHGRLLALARRLAARSPGIRESSRRGRLLCLPRRGGQPRHVRRRHADGGLPRRRETRERSVCAVHRGRSGRGIAGAVPGRRHGRSRRARRGGGGVRSAAPRSRGDRRLRPLRRDHDDAAPRGVGGRRNPSSRWR